jgi:hypothetical protein
MDIQVHIYIRGAAVEVAEPEYGEVYTCPPRPIRDEWYDYWCWLNELHVHVVALLVRAAHGITAP